MDYAHSDRVKQVENRIKSSFAAYESETTQLTPNPHHGDKPEDKLLRILRHQSSGDVREKVERLADSFLAKVRSHLSEIDDIENDAKAWRNVAEYLSARSDSLPDEIPSAIAAAVISVRKTDGALAASVASAAMTAAQSAESEVARLRDHYVPRTKCASRLVSYKRRAEHYKAANDSRRGTGF